MPERTIGRYRLYDAIASGGMAVVHLGRLVGAGGFARTVAIKRLHPHLATDPTFMSMLLDEARLAGRIRHPNVAPIFDVVVDRGEVGLVLEYIHGESLAGLLATSRQDGEDVPIPVALAIVAGALRGLSAAHEATADDGTALGLVHRDMSPQNILVGIDGMPRVIDFGVAKATSRLQTTQDGQMKGKFGYMAPEQLTLAPVDGRTDLFATGVVLWETLTGSRLFEATELEAVMRRTTEGGVNPPSRHRPEVEPALDGVVLRALSRRREDRFLTAAEMANALAAVGRIASPDEVSAWVRRTGGEELLRREARVAAVESGAGEEGVAAAAAELPTDLTPRAPEDRSTRTRSPALGRTAMLLLAGAVALGIAFFSGARFSPPSVSEASRETTPAEPSAIAASLADSGAVAASVALSGVALAPPEPLVAASSVPARIQGTVTRRPSPRHGSASARPEVPPYCSQRKLAFTVGADGIERPRPECL